MRHICLIIGYLLALQATLFMTHAQMRSLTLPSIPATMTKPEERAEYLVTHYWDHFDFQESSNLQETTWIEQALANYIDLAHYVSPEVMRSSLHQLLKKAEAQENMFQCFRELLEKYLYDIASPVRNEELFLQVLDYQLRSPMLSETDKIRPASLRELVARNRVGTQACDFTFTDPTGKSQRLYELPGEFTLVFFYDPECSDCRIARQEMIASSVIQSLLKAKRLSILAIYPGNDLASWKAYQPNLPSSWINGYDASMRIKNEELYDLQKTPTLYLLDSRKQVLLKDTTPYQIEQQLARSL